MKLTTILILTGVMYASASSYAQEHRVSVQVKDGTFYDVVTQIEKQSEFMFFYKSEEIDNNQRVTLVAKNKLVADILNELVENQHLAYRIIDKHIIITKVPPVTQQQGKRITGTVTDAATGESIIGANILEKGVTNGTVTDADGNFTLSVSENATLQVSYIGYITQEIGVIVSGKPLVIKLIEDTQALAEVVVVGYGTQKKVNLTGAVTAVSGEALSKRQVGQTSLALQGMAPGVTVTQRNGQPGVDGGSIRIRGVGTLNNSDPLILVDGLEMGINNLDVSTIESISVLKDAASSSIYGSKAANGVILITTKRAAGGKFNISYNGYVAQQSPTDLPEKVNAIDHILLLNESKVNAGAGVVYTDEQINDWRVKGPTDRDHYPDTDWQKEVLRGNGFQQNHALTMTGGTDKLKILASLGYMGQNGIIDNVNFERISLRLNTDFVFTKNFSSSLDVFLYNSNRNSVGTYNATNGANGSGIGFVFYTMNKFPAVQAMQYSDGHYAEGQNGDNPVSRIYEGGFYNETSTPVTGNLSFKWEPHKDFWMQTVFSPSIAYPQSKNYINQVSTYNPDGSVFSSLPSKATLTMQSDYSRYLQFRTTANYNKTVGRHTVIALAGFQYESNYNSGFSAFRDGFLFPEYSLLQSGSVENMRNDGWAGESVLMSWFGRINYDYQSKYLLEANIRYDGSSKFAQGRQWGAFPSFSAGWRLSEEAFWENLKDYVSNLKIRGSWGTLGNQNIGNYAFSSNIDMGTKYISEDKLLDGASVTTMNNPNISWETTTMTNVGLDLNLTNKISLNFDWYYKKTTDILMALAIPRTMGLNPTYQNAGTVENKGYDLNLTYTDKIGDFSFDASFNFSDVKNKIIDLKGIDGTGLVTNREGYAINSLYMLRNLGILSNEDFNSDGSYKWARQFRALAPGDLRFANTNDDDLVNDEDREVLGSTIPRYTYGFNFNGRYKGVDLNLLLQGVGKTDGYLSAITMYPFWAGGTAYEFHKDRWTEENQNTHAAFPRLYFYDEANNYRATDFYMKSAAYMRLKNIQLGYTIPVALSKKLQMEHLRFYVSGDNLLTLTNFWDGWDPEVSPASNGEYYPQVKLISFGVDIRF